MATGTVPDVIDAEFMKPANETSSDNTAPLASIRLASDLEAIGSWLGNIEQQNSSSMGYLADYGLNYFLRLVLPLCPSWVDDILTGCRLNMEL